MNRQTFLTFVVFSFINAYADLDSDYLIYVFFLHFVIFIKTFIANITCI